MQTNRIFFLLLSFCISHAQVVKQVDRRFERLSSVPTDIDANVTILFLGSNQITEIKQTDFNFKYPFLQEVHFAKNNITNVEDGCYNGTMINKINFHLNSLDRIPDLCAIGRTVEWISVARNNIKTISPENISCLKALQHLVIYSNPISTLPDLMSLLPSFNGLDIYSSRPGDSSSIPLECDCGVAWLKDFEGTLEIHPTPCHSPPSLVNTEWSSITKSHLMEICRESTFLYFTMISSSQQPQ